MNAFANPGGVPSLDKLPSVIDTLIKAGRARYAGAEPWRGRAAT